MTPGGAPDARRALAGVGRRLGRDGGAGAGAADEPAAHAGGLRAAGAEDPDEVSINLIATGYPWGFDTWF